MRRAVAIILASLFAQPSLAGPQEVCQEKVVEGQRLGLLRALKKDGGSIIVIVNEPAYVASSFDSKVGLAKNIQCAIVGEGKVLSDMQFRSDRSNKTLATWKFGDLNVE